MNQKKHFVTVAAALTSAAFLAPNLAARTCSGNGDIIGSYGITGSRSGFFLIGATPAAAGAAAGTGQMIPVAVTPPGTATGTGTGTTTTPFVGSSTSIGSLVAGLNNATVFSSVGRIFADGMGFLYASPTVGLMSNVQVGTYNVNTDCSVTVSLFDPFPAANAGMVPVTTTPPGTATGTGTTTGTGSVTTTGVQAGKVTLQGLILNNAAEIDLVATNSSAAGATVRLVKTAQFSSCTNATLSGPYTISGTGEYLPSAGSSTLTSGTGSATTGTTTTVTTTTSTLPAGTLAGAFFPGVTGSQGTPFNLLGRFVADGTGNFATDSASLASPLTAGFSGTYTVNADCTGSGRLTDQNGVSRNISFVVVNTAAQCSIGAIPQSSSRQDLQFVFSDPGVFGSGTASPQ